jgi:hypothetical protein
MSQVYDKSESAKTRLRLALKYNFGKITKSEGYNNDIGDIYTAFVDRRVITNFPAVVLMAGVEKVLNSDMSDDLLHKEVQFAGLACLREAEDADLAREEFLADIETMIGINFTLNDESGNPGCMVCEMTGSEPFGMVANQPQIGFAFGIKIIYRQEIDDASILA